MLVILLVSAVLASAAPAAASTPAKPEPKPQAKADEIVCKWVTPPGSRFSHRACLTRAEWNRRADEARQDVETIQRRADQMNPR